MTAPWSEAHDALEAWARQAQMEETLEAFFRDARRDLVPKLRDTAVFMSFAPEHDPDPKMAMELGLAVMLDMPILLIVFKGRTLSAKLRRIADAIVEDVEIGDPADIERVRLAVISLLEERKPTA